MHSGSPNSMHSNLWYSWLLVRLRCNLCQTRCDITNLCRLLPYAFEELARLDTNSNKLPFESWIRWNILFLEDTFSFMNNNNYVWVMVNWTREWWLRNDGSSFDRGNSKKRHMVKLESKSKHVACHHASFWRSNYLVGAVVSPIVKMNDVVTISKSENRYVSRGWLDLPITVSGSVRSVGYGSDCHARELPKEVFISQVEKG